jgi:hypothetical protein
MGENPARKRLEQGIDQARYELAHVDESHGDRARTRARIHEMRQRLAELDRWS